MSQHACGIMAERHDEDLARMLAFINVYGCYIHENNNVDTIN